MVGRRNGKTKRASYHASLDHYGFISPFVSEDPGMKILTLSQYLKLTSKLQRSQAGGPVQRLTPDEYYAKRITEACQTITNR